MDYKFGSVLLGIRCQVSGISFSLFAFRRILWICFLLSACQFNPNIQGTGEKFLQGEWEEDSVQYQEQLLKYTRHKLTFTCDSFYAVMTTKSSVKANTDSCFAGGMWTEYAKGIYFLRNDTLYLTGTFTKANFKQKISGCHRIGQYLPVFIIKEQSPEKLTLESRHVLMNLKLKKEIICQPKPLF